MPPEILEYIASQRVGVLAVEMLDGAPHGATVHFAHSEKPLTFLFETYREYRKAEPLFGRECTRASLVIGFDERNMKTLQMDGVVRCMTAKERTELFDVVYLEKFPEKKIKLKNPTWCLCFYPHLVAFTDWTSRRVRIVASTDETYS